MAVLWMLLGIGLGASIPLFGVPSAVSFGLWLLVNICTFMAVVMLIASANIDGQ